MVLTLFWKASGVLTRQSFYSAEFLQLRSLVVEFVANDETMLNFVCFRTFDRIISLRHHQSVPPIKVLSRSKPLQRSIDRRIIHHRQDAGYLPAVANLSAESSGPKIFCESPRHERGVPSSFDAFCTQCTCVFLYVRTNAHVRIFVHAYVHVHVQRRCQMCRETF
jgi:hypothetical protein